MTSSSNQTADQTSAHGAQARHASGHLSVSKDGGVGRISFFHPKGNSLPASLLGAMADAVTDLGRDDAVRVIVMESEGSGAFCAGASFDELVNISNPEQGQRFFSGFSSVVLAMIRAPKFIITRVHGRAAGGAVGVIAASDFSIAVRSASARLSELRVGIGPFVVGPAIERKIGLAAFSQMAVDADWRDAEWCERHGLYARLADDAESLNNTVNEMAHTLAASNPEAMAGMKRIFWSGTEHWDALLAERATMSGRMALSPFTRQAISSFKSR